MPEQPTNICDIYKGGKSEHTSQTLLVRQSCWPQTLPRHGPSKCKSQWGNMTYAVSNVILWCHGRHTRCHQPALSTAQGGWGEGQLCWAYGLLFIIISPSIQTLKTINKKRLKQKAFVYTLGFPTDSIGKATYVTMQLIFLACRYFISTLMSQRNSLLALVSSKAGNGGTAIYREHQLEINLVRQKVRTDYTFPRSHIWAFIWPATVIVVFAITHKLLRVFLDP